MHHFQANSPSLSTYVVGPYNKNIKSTISLFLISSTYSMYMYCTPLITFNSCTFINCLYSFQCQTLILIIRCMTICCHVMLITFYMCKLVCMLFFENCFLPKKKGFEFYSFYTLRIYFRFSVCFWDTIYYHYHIFPTTV